MLSACPVSHEPLALSKLKDSYPTDADFFVIIVEKGKQPDKDGFVVQVSATDTNLALLRSNVAKRSSEIDTIPDAVAFEDSEGNEVVSIGQVQRNRVIYLAQPISGREVTYVPGSPVVGIALMIMDDMRGRYVDIFDKYDDTFSFHMFGTKGMITRDPDVTNVMIDDGEYFEKSMRFPWSELHELSGNGLFTSPSGHRDWKLAHRLLVPAFSASAMKLYGHRMAEISEQACEWLGSHIGVPIDMVSFATNITFQMIGKIGFDYDFNLLDPAGTGQHPFTEGMDYCLQQMNVRFFRTSLWKYLPIAANRMFTEHMRNMKATVQQVIDERRNSPEAASMKRDLLGFMLNARAPDEDGNLVGLSDQLIQDEILTFGIAGTETSSSTIAFVLQLLDKHRDVQHRALQELAAAGITADMSPTIQQTNKLAYLTQIIYETLRLFPPVSGLLRICKKDCILPGGLIIRKGDVPLISIWSLQRNPKSFPNPTVFDPDRFSPENIKNIKPGAWIPFSTGDRACLGRQFAMMEIRAVLARLLSRYEFHDVGDGELRYHPTKLTTSPMDLFMTVQKRTGLPDADTPLAADATGANGNHTIEHAVLHPLTHTVSADRLPRTFVVYGSNMGTSDDYATQMAEQLKRMGFADITLVPLNDWDFASMQSADGTRSLVVAITSTYNGMPPDNARNFAKLLDQETHTDILKDVDFALFGCGNSLWHTFLKFPRHLYQRLDELGATPLTEFTAGDSNDDLDDEFMKWSLQVGMILTDHYGSSVDAYIDAATDKSLPYSLKYVDHSPAAPFRLLLENASVKVNRELQDVERSGRSTRHIEITLDDTSDISYTTGDHLNIYPVNAAGVVREVSAILELELDVVFELEQVSDASRFARSAAAAIHGRACTVADALQYVCDWKEAPSRELVVALSETSGNEPAYGLLRKAAEDINTLGKQSAGWNAFTAHNRTVLDVLRTYAPLVRQIPFATLLHFVSAMDPRRYSIASCQLVVGNEVHISAAIVNDAVNGRSYGGLATEYLASLERGARVSVSHLPAQDVFHLPPSSDVPVVFVGAGTGVAPFRGFLQEMKHAGIGGATMYFGCRSPEYDYLYKDELEQYVQDGTLSKLQTAFSRVGDERKYVQHHVSQDGAKIWSHLQNSGRIYVCGSADKLGKSMSAAMVRIFEEHGGLSADEASTYLSDLISDGRYAQDIW